MEELFTEMEQFAALNHVPIINERGRGAFVATVQKYRPKRVLEIGTAIGYSTLLIAQNAARDVKITTLELSEERIATAKRYIDRSNYANQIEILGGDAGELLLELSKRGEKYDFVFIDAAKGQYVDYFNKLQALITNDAIILADNVLFRGYVRGNEPAPRRYRTIVKRLHEYLQLVTQPPFTTEVLEKGDGLAITRTNS